MKLAEICRSIAFYLPQYHSIPENDRWWGTGFTEWTNVTRASPQFRGHYQPHLPADLGFYDLRVAESREAQASLARSYGIHGFCYYHYWFKGKRLLERPFNEVLSSAKPDFPFSLCWANETWSRRWLGDEKDILMAQEYSEEDDLKHAHSLLPAFADQRYICIDDRPLFLIYRPLDLPSPERTTETLREVSVKQGLAEPYLVGVNAHCMQQDCSTIGFDHTLNFTPQLGVLPDAFLEGRSAARFIKNLAFGRFNSRQYIQQYSKAIDIMQQYLPDYPYIPCVFVGWDNTPRRGKNSIVLHNQTPERFKQQVIDALREAKPLGESGKIIFINAWNEWAEGNHLEPDLKQGHAYLEALRDAISCRETGQHARNAEVT